MFLLSIKIQEVEEQIERILTEYSDFVINQYERKIPILKFQILCVRNGKNINDITIEEFGILQTSWFPQLSIFITFDPVFYIVEDDDTCDTEKKNNK